MLSHSTTFIPTPEGCSHQEIKEQVEDFIRKFQWHDSFAWPTELTANRNRFGPTKSGAWPPSKAVSNYTKKLSRDIREATKSILMNCNRCYPQDNLSRLEKMELERLRNCDIVIKPADKGQRWVILSASSYEDEINRHLGNANNYKRISESLLPYTANRLKQMINHLRSSSFITNKEKLYLWPPEDSSNRTFNILPKIHKNEWRSDSSPPGRPIVSDVNSESRRISNFIDFFLRPLAEKSPSFLLDSLHVIAILREMLVPVNSFLFTLDVESLYTTTPVDETIDIISDLFVRYPDKRRPDLTLISLLKLVLKNNDFKVNNTHWKQISGVAMGKAFAGSFCNIFMNHWEEGAIASFHLKPHAWYRYQDDIFGIWTHSEYNFVEFVSHLNRHHASIKVTSTISPTSTHFLDLCITLHADRLKYKVAFKTTDSHFVLSKSSFHPPHTHRGVIYSQIHRAVTYSSSRIDFKETLKLLTPIWYKLNVSRSLVRNISSTILDITNQKHNWETGFFPCGVRSCPCEFSSRTVTF